MKAAARLALPALLLAGLILVADPARGQAPAGSDANPAPAGVAGNASKPVMLDRVVAIIDGDVLLESDVQEELRFALLEPIVVPSGSDSLRRAARRLINRTLILQQMKEQQQAAFNVSDSDVEKQLAEIRRNLPACRQYDCTTDAGWKAFLAANDLTEQDVIDHWRLRMEILHFIDIRFRAGIRISKQEVADYYQKSIVPAYAKSGEKPPPAATLAPRIQEVLLQQHVNGLLQDWLRTLRQEGSVQILDPAYGQSSTEPDENE